MGFDYCVSHSLPSFFLSPISCISSRLTISLSKVRPHCGPSNGRLRLHVGLDVHPEDVDKMGLKVGGHTLRWVNGQTLAFDDSFEHGVREMCATDLRLLASSIQL